MAPESPPRYLLIGAWCAAGLSVVLGAMVWLGWHTDAPLLIQVAPGFVPMQYNAALGFLCCGFGLLGCLRQKWGWARGLGAGAAIIGGLTLLQYLFGWQLGIDQLLMEHSITTKTSHPGRMAPNTALCFLLVGLALSWPRAFQARVAGLLGAVVLGFGIIAMVGYGVGLEGTYGWGKLTRMAIHTAFGFLCLGGGLVAFTSHSNGHDTLKLPTIVAAMTLTFTVSVWFALLAREESYLKAQLSQRARATAALVRSYLRETELALERMAHRRAADAQMKRSAWEVDARQYLRHTRAYQAIKWADRGHVIRWAYPAKGEQASVGLGVKAPLLQSVLRAARTRDAQATSLLELKGGARGFVMVAPVIGQGSYRGAILGFVDFQRLLEAAISPATRQRYRIALWEGLERLYFSSPGRPLSPNSARESVAFLGRRWQLQLTPTRASEGRQRSSLPGSALLVGLLFSWLVTWISSLSQRARLRSFQLAQAHQALKQAHDELEQRVQERTLSLTEANQQLQREIQIRTETEAQLAQQNDALLRSNRELDRFAYAASHDLKAPLRGMRNLLSWVAEDAGEQLPEAARGHIEKAQRRLIRMQDLLDDLLQYSRVGRDKAAAEELSLEALFEELRELLVVPEGISLELRSSQLSTFNAKKVPLLQVLLNLLDNAIKHHQGPTGHITLSVRPVGDWVEFSVGDDGPGIEARFHERIFGLFQRLHPDDEVPGTGIGLALVRKTVEFYGGAISMESAPGEGTTITFTWPMDSS